MPRVHRPKLVGDKDRLIPAELRAHVLAHAEARYRKHRLAPGCEPRSSAARNAGSLYFALQLADLAGLRISEVVKLQMRDCDVSRKPYRLMIRASKHRTAAHADEQPIGEELAALLRPWVTAARCYDRHVVGWRMRPYSRQWILHLCKEAHQACVVPSIYNFHSWRHGYGTRIYQATKDLVFTSRMLRHRSVKPTERYVHMSQSDDELDNVLAAIAQRPARAAKSTKSPQRQAARRTRR